MPPESTIHIYRIVQEALTNVSRHAGAKEAWVRMAQPEGWLALAIEDRGRGLPPATPWRGASASSACASARS